MARREFPKDIYAQIVRRAIQPSGEIACEGCGLVLGKKPYHVDHTIADALLLDKTRKLTADDGKLLGVECCHAPKTKIDVKNIAEAKRREAKHLGIKRPKQTIKSAPFPAIGRPASQQCKPLPPRRPLYQQKG
jgi:hypothetical protein